MSETQLSVLIRKNSEGEIVEIKKGKRGRTPTGYERAKMTVEEIHRHAASAEIDSDVIPAGSDVPVTAAKTAEDVIAEDAEEPASTSAEVDVDVGLVFKGARHVRITKRSTLSVLEKGMHYTDKTYSNHGSSIRYNCVNVTGNLGIYFDYFKFNQVFGAVEVDLERGDIYIYTMDANAETPDTVLDAAIISPESVTKIVKGTMLVKFDQRGHCATEFKPDHTVNFMDDTGTVPDGFYVEDYTQAGVDDDVVAELHIE